MGEVGENRGFGRGTGTAGWHCRYSRQVHALHDIELRCPSLGRGSQRRANPSRAPIAPSRVSLDRRPLPLASGSGPL